jgi:hypothetical protein
MMTYEQPAPGMTCDKPAPDTGLRRVIRANVLTVVFEVIVPMVLFYGLRAAGVSQWWALMAGVLVAVPYVGWTVARNRRVDLLAVFTLSVLVLSVVLGLLSDDPRTLAIREGWTAALGGPLGHRRPVPAGAADRHGRLGRRAARQRGGPRRARLHAADRPHLRSHHRGVVRLARPPDHLARLVHPQGKPRRLTLIGTLAR